MVAVAAAADGGAGVVSAQDAGDCHRAAVVSGSIGRIIAPLPEPITGDRQEKKQEVGTSEADLDSGPSTPGRGSSQWSDISSTDVGDNPRLAARSPSPVGTCHPDLDSGAALLWRDPDYDPDGPLHEVSIKCRACRVETIMKNAPSSATVYCRGCRKALRPGGLVASSRVNEFLSGGSYTLQEVAPGEG